MKPPASRNAPCPCGSGRRYKDCHGALGAPVTRDPLQRALARGIAAQREGLADEAIAAYEAALAIAPGHFDALHMLGVARFQRGDFDAALDAIDAALARNGEVESARFNRGLVQAAIDRRHARAELQREAASFAARMREPTVSGPGDDARVRVIAFYLPQYHRIPENDAWWGDGFTEWTNVRKARPSFDGHWQPHEPGELGYYDLTDARVRDAQAELARTHGIDAFCYYYYWFGGKRLLERPLAEVIASGRPDFPFCICWANENWTRRWDGRDGDVLMAQRYSPEHARAFIDALLPLFADRRYVRIRGRPLLAVYKPGDIPDVADMIATWRRVCREAGAADPYLCSVERHANDDRSVQGFDAAIEFPPIGHAAENVTATVHGASQRFRGVVFDYWNLAAHYLMLPRPAHRHFRGVTPMWDNTARRQDDAMIVAGSTPELFGVWLTHALRQTLWRNAGDERVLFVNAWNEWAEGNHLEPDARFGYRYLEAVRTARALATEPPVEPPTLAAMEAQSAALIRERALTVEHRGDTRVRGKATLAVVMPIYNHARFVERTLASLAVQTRRPDVLLAIDDGSSDDSAAIVARFAESAPFPVLLARQPNAGAYAALNHGLALATTELVAVINSDDAYAPARLERLVGALGEGTDLAFSDAELIDDYDAPVHGPYARTLRERIASAGVAENLLYPLVHHNVAISTGNLVFRRALLERIGGFASYVVCHDWDFVLRATYATRFAFVREPLYRYRLHDANTFAARPIAGAVEGEQALQRFFGDIDRHPWLAGDARSAFLAYARRTGLGGYLAFPR